MKNINADEVSRQIANAEQTIPVINVLDSKHFESKHIPRSINIPLESDDFVRRVEEEVGGKSDPVIVYCASADCDASEKAAEKLEQAGFRDVQDFAAGMEGWEEAGYEVDGAEANKAY